MADSSIKPIFAALKGARERRLSNPNLIVKKYGFDPRNKPWLYSLEGDGIQAAQFSPALFAKYLEDHPQALEPCPDPDIPSDETWRAMKIGGIARYTYFARGRYTGRIKIGMSKDPWQRVRSLASASGGEDAELLVFIRDDCNEALYQDAFSIWRHCYEWFAPHPSILAEIGRLLACPIMSKDFRR